MRTNQQEDKVRQADVFHFLDLSAKKNNFPSDKENDCPDSGCHIAADTFDTHF